VPAGDSSLGNLKNPHAEFPGPISLPDDYAAHGSLGLFTGVPLCFRLGVLDDLHSPWVSSNGFQRMEFILGHQVGQVNRSNFLVSSFSAQDLQILFSSDQGGNLMRERYATKSGPIIVSRKERKCLRCGKKLIGKWLCPACIKYNSSAGDLSDRYELHGLSIIEHHSFSEF
jgi:hypothetical protein